MTSKLKFDVINPAYFGGAQDFQFNRIFCLSTPWALNLQFKSFWVVSSELYLVTQSGQFTKVVLTF